MDNLSLFHLCHIRCFNNPQVIPSLPTQLFHLLYHPSEKMAPLARCRGAVVDVEINGLEKQMLVINVVNIVLKGLVINVLLSSG